MKVIAQPIEMVAWFNSQGEPHPVRFRFTNKDSSRVVVVIDTVVTKSIEKLAGNKMFIFTCKSVINGEEKVYEIKYEIGTCKWILFKI